ncbi:MAG: presenilin family intramembrane aspartyl protease PSH, partial [Halobacteriales archaeon]|nr:presenilin family intramembrane aspartyl protease PSH [Halobacteriales archaeon]
MVSRGRLYVAVGATIGIFVVIQLGALSLIEPFKQAGYQTVENPSDPTNSLIYIVAIFIATGVILAVLKFGIERLLRLLIVSTSGLLSLYVFSVLVPPFITYQGLNVTPWVMAIGVAATLYAYPEWYVIDIAGIIVGAGGAGLFGISFGPLPAILLLSVLAVYDAVSVYGTEHMLTLAEGVTDLKLPLILIIPVTLSYSFLEANPVASDGSGEDAAVENDPEPEDSAPDRTTASGDDDQGFVDRDAFVIGLGDAVMPSVMVASAAFFSPAPAFGVPGIAINLPALMAMVGTVVGVCMLMWMVAKGRAHAGLPLLNGGAIGGYLLGSLAAGVE